MNLATILFFTGLRAESVSYCPTRCTCDGTKVSCVELDWKILPQLPIETTELDLSGNKFRSVDVSHLAALTRLVLDENPIDRKCFLPPSTLSLSMVNCQLTQIIDVGSAKSSIKVLNLAKNRLKQIGTLDFSGWSELTDVDFTDNRLSGRPQGNNGNRKKADKNLRGIPNTVKNLILDGNRLTALSLGMFDNLNGLQKLYVRRNRLRQIDTHGTFTERHENLKILDLSDNKIDRLGQFTFKYLSGLTSLDLSRNQLRSKDSLQVASLFIENSRLERLNISRNFLTTVSYEMLYQAQTLTSLDLSFNNISTISSTNPTVSPWQDVRNLQNLDLSQNDLERIEDDSFLPLIKLKNLNLASNKIRTLEENAFKGLQSVTQLNLEKNAIINDLEDMSDVFLPLQELSDLHLEENNLRRITSSTFIGLKKLVKLDLRKNPITEIEFESFSNSLQRLRLDSSQFLCDCNIFWLTSWLQNRTFVLTDEDRPQCHHPTALKGQKLTRVDPQELKCDSNPRPVMATDPLSKSVQIGTNAKFSCSAKTTELESVEVEWLYQEKTDSVAKVLENDPDLISIKITRPSSGSRVQSSITLKHVEISAKGFYKCIIRNHYDSVQSDVAQLDVHQMPSFSSRAKNRTVLLGEKVNLSCRAEGYPDPIISWTRADGYNFDDVRGRLVISPDARTLTISDVKEKDTGKYSCVASNKAGNVTQNVFIQMAPEERLIKFDRDVKFKKGTDAVLKCGYPPVFPPVSVTWFFKNQEIEKSPRHHFTDNGHVLVIESSLESDSGLYQCKIYNSAGSTTGVTQLKISEKSHLDDHLPSWVWIVGVATSAILLTSLAWLCFFCFTRRRQSDSELGTGSTNLPLPLERHLADNQKATQRLAQQMMNSRSNEVLRSTPMTASSQSENDRLLGTGSQTPTHSIPMGFQKPVPNFHMYHQIPPGYPSFNPYAPPPQMFGYSPYLIPQTQSSKIETPYYPPTFMGQKCPQGGQMWTPRAATMPDLDQNYQTPTQNINPNQNSFFQTPVGFQTPTRSTHNVPYFTNLELDLANQPQSAAPGPDRSRRKARRSEPAHLHQLQNTPRRGDPPRTPIVKVKDDSGIVQRLLGPIESSPQKAQSSDNIDQSETLKRERRKTEA